MATTHLYPLPENGIDALFALFGEIDEVHGLGVHWDLLPMNVLQVRDDKAAVFLRLRFSDRLPVAADGEDILDPDDVLIPDGERAECERLLRTHCRAEHRWFAIALLTFTRAGAQAAFGAAYEAMFGAGSTCADSGWKTPGAAPRRRTKRSH